jgi:hypothetical protein
MMHALASPQYSAAWRSVEEDVDGGTEQRARSSMHSFADTFRS